MAMGMKGLLVLTLGLAMAATSSAVIYKVGDTSGWTILGNINYTDWTTKKDFKVGDIIEFKYPQGIHNVLEVNKADYDSCSNSTPIATHTSGDDKIAIKRPGHRFFICGVPGHCAAGQKVNVRVLKQNKSSDAPSKAPAPARSAAASPTPSGGGGSERSAASPPAASSTDSTPDATATAAPAPNANSAGGRPGYRAAVLAVALAAVASMAVLQ
ncbi:unnamed protein product [Urochloa humidicola]